MFLDREGMHSRLSYTDVDLNGGLQGVGPIVVYNEVAACISTVLEGYL